jgi:hypothetical protein
MLLHFTFNNWLWLVITILCVWRITSLICYEAGPFDILSRLRKVMYKFHMGGLAECFHCMGFWISALIVLLVFDPGVYLIFIVPAVSGGASIIERFIS